MLDVYIIDPKTIYLLGMHIIPPTSKYMPGVHTARLIATHMLSICATFLAHVYTPSPSRCRAKTQPKHSHAPPLHKCALCLLNHDSFNFQLGTCIISISKVLTDTIIPIQELFNKLSWHKIEYKTTQATNDDPNHDLYRKFPKYNIKIKQKVENAYLSTDEASIFTWIWIFGDFLPVKTLKTLYFHPGLLFVCCIL